MSNLEVLVLASNDLTGTIPQELINLEKLRSLILDDLDLEGEIPAFENTILSELWIRNNKFIFEDFEPNFEFLATKLDADSYAFGFRYKNQQKIDNIERIELNTGSQFTISVDNTSSTNNQYQWRKDGVEIPNAINSTFTIETTSINDAGEYDCLITNGRITDLTLEKNPVYLTVTAEVDDDNDEVTNINDNCPNTPTGETVDANGCSQSQLDDDNDGVANALDNCPNTAVNIPVDANGCPTLTDNADIPADAIQVKVTSTSCPNRDNGEITVSFDTEYSYTVQITAALLDNTFDNINSTTGLVRSNLAPDNYTVCVTLPDLPNFERCFTVSVETPEDFESGKTIINQNKKQGSLIVSGSKNYELIINDKTMLYSFDNTGTNQLDFPLKEGLNTLIAQTDKVCQGVFQESILLNVVQTFPNPTVDNTTIVGIQNSDDATILISDMSGTIVKRINQSIKNSSLSISVADLAAGVYLVRITTEVQDVQTKIVKK